MNGPVLFTMSLQYNFDAMTILCLSFLWVVGNISHPVWGKNGDLVQYIWFLNSTNQSFLCNIFPSETWDCISFSTTLSSQNWYNKHHMLLYHAAHVHKKISPSSLPERNDNIDWNNSYWLSPGEYELLQIHTHRNLVSVHSIILIYHCSITIQLSF